MLDLTIALPGLAPGREGAPHELLKFFTGVGEAESGLQDINVQNMLTATEGDYSLVSPARTL